MMRGTCTVKEQGCVDIIKTEIRLQCTNNLSEGAASQSGPFSY